MNREPVTLLSSGEIEKMRIAGKMAAELLHHLGDLVKPGITTQSLNDEAERWTKDRGFVSAPLGYGDGPPARRLESPGSFPRSICTSVNDVVCHGIPDEAEVLKDGDIINIDVTPIVDGFHGDTSRTFFVGTPDPATRKLVETTEECLRLGIREVGPGKRIGDIGAAIQAHAEGRGFSVVRDFVGHGIGRTFHTAPQVPHFGRKGKGRRMEPGMVFTVEPMINVGTWKVDVLDDGWTAVTQDRKLSAQFEHTLVVTEAGVEVLTLREGDSYPL
jgi:methionyl aminopeptidase